MSKYQNLHAHHPFCSAWRNMHGRCYSITNQAYETYGAKGIKVAQDWHSFDQFYNDMFSTWKKGLFLDRKDNQFGYSKDNCRWASPKQSAQNRSTTKLSLEKVSKIKQLREAHQTQKQIAERFGVTYQTIQGVLDGSYW